MYITEMASRKKEPIINPLTNSDAGTLTVDAVHPFFKGYTGQLRDAQTSTDDDLAYLCKECEVYFPKNIHSVMEHFQKRTHMPVDSCVYCCGPVCEYYYNCDRLVFHNCEDLNASNKSSNSFFSVIKRKLSLRNSGCDVI